jgi:hypothetical protein
MSTCVAAAGLNRNAGDGAWRDAESSTMTLDHGSGDAEASPSTDIDAVAEEGVPTSASNAHGPVRWPSGRPIKRGRDQAGPSALAPRLGVHGVVATLIGDVTEERVVAPSSVQAAAGDSSSRSSPAFGAKAVYGEALCESSAA